MLRYYRRPVNFSLCPPEIRFAPCPACNDQDGPPCPVCGSSEDALYACNLGAGGIDYRCAKHLQEVLAAPENEGITRDDYVAVPASEGRCEACDA